MSTPPCIHHLPFSFLLAWAGESSWYQEDPAGLEPGACELLSQLLLEHNNFLHNLLTVHTEQQQQKIGICFYFSSAVLPRAGWHAGVAEGFLPGN